MRRGYLERRIEDTAERNCPQRPLVWRGKRRSCQKKRMCFNDCLIMTSNVGGGLWGEGKRDR
jgi:hypothetical protein